MPKGETADLELVNLAKDVDERDQGNLKFELDGTMPQASKPSWKGRSSKSPRTTPSAPGARGTIPLKVTDGRSDAVKATVTATVVASNRPMPAANDDVSGESQRRTHRDHQRAGKRLQPLQ